MNVADRTPQPVKGRRFCQRCGDWAIWNVWRGFYCDSDARRAGWLPGPVRRPGDQMELR